MTDLPRSTEMIVEPSLGALVSIRSRIPEDAMSASLLGTERTGHGVRIRDDGLILTIGYVINEAEEIWISSANGMAAPGVVVGNDFRSGLALLKPTLTLSGSVVSVGRSAALNVGDPVIVAGSDEADPQVIDAQVVAKQEFAGRWEYLLEEAIFTAPPHESWSGAALFDLRGKLCGIGSLVIQGFEVDGSLRTVNMFVPVDIVLPVIDELCEHGRRLTPPRPWLGLLVHEEDDELTVVGVYRNCPADEAGLRPGDIVLRIGEQPVHSLAHMFRTVWSLGDAGVDVPVTVQRNAQRHEAVIKSAARSEFLRKGTLQ